jgi:hypothetical protein
MAVTVFNGFTRIIGGCISANPVKPLQIIMNNTSVSGQCNSSSQCTATTNSASGTANNGVLPYAYSWEVVSDPNNDFTIDSPNSNSTTFSANVVCNVLGCSGSTINGTFRLKVTDALGKIVYGENVSVSVCNTSTTCV